MRIPGKLFVWLAALVWFASAATAQARRPYGTLSERGYEEMRQLAQQLDAQARHANDQALHQDYWVYRYNSRFARAVNDFAHRANRFNERMANYRAAPWRVDDELRSLLRSAQNVQSLARSSRAAEEHTLADWNETVRILNRMIRLYDFDVRGSGRYEWGWSQAPQSPQPPPPDYRRGYEPQQPAEYVYRRNEIAALSRELAVRASRAHQMAEGLNNANWGWRHRQYFEAIHHFDDQARSFDQLVESGQMDRQALRDEARHLLEDARRADRDMRQNNIFPEVWEEWRGAMQVLERILIQVGV
jgi:hypothetical protein